jgi:hypothetical protein
MIQHQCKSLVLIGKKREEGFRSREDGELRTEPSIPLVACLVLRFALGAFRFLPLKVNGATTAPLSVECIYALYYESSGSCINAFR